MKTHFERAAEVRAFLKQHGYEKVKVRWSSNPFGGKGLFFVSLTDIPPNVTLVSTGGSLEPSNTYGDHAPTIKRIADLRALLKTTDNATVDH